MERGVQQRRWRRAEWGSLPRLRQRLGVGPRGTRCGACHRDIAFLGRLAIIAVGQGGYEAATHHPHIEYVRGDCGSLFISLCIALICAGLGVLALLVWIVWQRRVVGTLAVISLVTALVCGFILTPHFAAKVAAEPDPAAVAPDTVMAGLPPAPSGPITVQCGWSDAMPYLTGPMEPAPCTTIRAQYGHRQGMPEFVLSGLSVAIWDAVRTNPDDRWDVVGKLRLRGKSADIGLGTNTREGTSVATDGPDADLAVTAEVGDSNDTADVLYITLLEHNNPDLYRTLSVPLQ